MSPGDAEEPFACVVRVPGGVASVRVDRRGLALSARGGFEARWAEGGGADAAACTPEAFRLRVRDHLAACARTVGTMPTTAMLNLAAHQLVDDVVGWAHLNADRETTG